MPEITLHSGQMEVYAHPARYKVVVAGRRWGKTALSRAYIIRYAKKAKQLIWYVAPTYRMARQIMWRDLIDVIPRKWIKRLNETMLIIELKNGTVIELKGADKPDTLRGVGLNLVVLDEFQDFKLGVWHTILRPTLASTRGHALFIGTPKAFNQLYQLFDHARKVQAEGGNQWAGWQYPTIMSPFIPESEIEEARRDMDEKTFRQEFEACHLPDTEVQLYGGGVRKIGELKIGDVLCHLTDDGEVVPCVVLGVGETGFKQVYDATLETGDTISASDYHKFKVYE